MNIISAFLNRQNFLQGQFMCCDISGTMHLYVNDNLIAKMEGQKVRLITANLLTIKEL